MIPIINYIVRFGTVSDGDDFANENNVHIYWINDTDEYTKASTISANSIDHILNNDDRVLQFSRVREYYCVDVLVAFNSACSPLTKGILEPLLTCMLLLFAGLSFRISFKGGGGKKEKPLSAGQTRVYAPLFRAAPKAGRGAYETVLNERGDA